MAIPLTIMPVPLRVTAEAPDRFVPVRVTFTVVPRRPMFGLIVVSVVLRVPGVPWNSTAPWSIWVSPAPSGRGFPKKSVLGTVAPVGTISAPVPEMVTALMAGEFASSE